MPTPPANSYATAPSSYVAPGSSYPVAAQYAIPMNSYAIPQYAVAPSYVVPYPTPPAYVRPPPVYVTPPPVYITPPPTTTTTTTTTTIPPPRCFQNTNGFKCCNRMLDQFLDMKVTQMQRPEWQRCNLQRFATQLQLEAQAMFNHSMESIIASGDMQNLARYRGDLYCKKRSLDGKVILKWTRRVQIKTILDRVSVRIGSSILFGIRSDSSDERGRAANGQLPGPLQRDQCARRPWGQHLVVLFSSSVPILVALIIIHVLSLLSLSSIYII